MTTTSQHAPPAVRLSHLTKRYGAVTAVDGLDLTVPAGELMALLGPNGAGSTQPSGWSSSPGRWSRR
jgi:ABC-2 type transport system ATP-binding protein